MLVTYATRSGTTVGVAEAIAETLRTCGVEVDVAPIGTLNNIARYDAAVIGSAIRMGRWLPKAVKYVEAHREALNRIPTAYFTVCITLQEDTPENRQIVAAYTDPVREIVKPAQEAYFAGRMDPGLLNFLEKLMVKAIKPPLGDFRDWEAIRAWAESLPAHLLPVS
jgi:menaquinone-dependent protoporphyrinogen oxidase